MVEPLHVAKNEKVIELLLEAGWSPNVRDHDGNTAAHLHVCFDPETSSIYTKHFIIVWLRYKNKEL